jgi:hypothetical protein
VDDAVEVSHPGRPASPGFDLLSVIPGDGIEDAAVKLDVEPQLPPQGFILIHGRSSFSTFTIATPGRKVNSAPLESYEKRCKRDEVRSCKKLEMRVKKKGELDFSRKESENEKE